MLLCVVYREYRTLKVVIILRFYCNLEEGVNTVLCSIGKYLFQYTEPPLISKWLLYGGPTVRTLRKECMLL